MTLIAFLAGFILGVSLMVFIIALCTAAKRGDENQREFENRVKERL